MSTLSLAATQQAYIVGAPRRPGFNGQGAIDLNDYTEMLPPTFEGCTFSHFQFLDLTTVNIDTEVFANIGIRQEFDGADGNRIDELEVSFENNGFEAVDWPPSIDNNGEFIDGRGRTKAAINRNERWLPVAVYDRDDVSISNTVTNGLKANLGGRPRSTASFRDIVNGGVHLINEGELKSTPSDINNWLKKRLELWRFFKPELITKMGTAIKDEAERDESLILRMKTSQWHAWVKRNLSLDTEKGDYVLVNAHSSSYNTYVQRLWCDSILPAIIDGTDPVQVIFYTSQYSPEDARKGLKESIKKLEELYTQSIELTKIQFQRSGINLDGILASTGATLITSKPYVIKGACPQIVQSHDFNSGKLIDVNKY
jgi:hypothetical protein